MPQHGQVVGGMVVAADNHQADQSENRRDDRGGIDDVVAQPYGVTEMPFEMPETGKKVFQSQSDGRTVRGGHFDGRLLLPFLEFGAGIDAVVAFEDRSERFQ